MPSGGGASIPSLPDGSIKQSYPQCTRGHTVEKIEIALPEIWKSEFRYSEIAYFVLDNLSISVGILVKALPHLRCVAVFTNVSTEIMIRYAQKQI